MTLRAGERQRALDIALDHQPVSIPGPRGVQMPARLAAIHGLATEAPDARNRLSSFDCEHQVGSSQAKTALFNAIPWLNFPVWNSRLKLSARSRTLKGVAVA